MRVEYDNHIDALYVTMREDFVFRSVELEDGIKLDFDKLGRLLGIEILDARARYNPHEFSSLLGNNWQ